MRSTSHNLPSLLRKQKARKLGKEEMSLHKRAHKMNCQEYLMRKENYEAVKRRLKTLARRKKLCLRQQVILLS